MSKRMRGLMTLGLLGGASVGAFKAVKHYEYLKETHNNVILFNGERLVYDEIFEGDSVAAVAAGIEIDLREAKFDADFTSLDVYGIASGFRIIVPTNIQVMVTGINRASGVQLDVDEEVEGKVLNINYDLTGSGLLVTAQDA